MDAIRSRLLALRPEIKQIMKATGTAGMTYGIFHQGQILHIDQFGHRDIEKALPLDENTMFPICSMTKGMVSAVLGMLVDEGKLKFDDYVADLLPSFDPPDKAFKAKSRLSDWLSMQSGAQGYQCWVQSQNHIIIAKENAMSVINSLKSKADMRTEFTYSNWGYELAAQVIKELTGESWDTHVHRRIFDPLQLKRTDARGVKDEFDNVAVPYIALDDATPIPIPPTPISASTVNGAAGGIRSCVKDLLVLYQAVLAACTDQFRTGKATTDGSVFKNLTETMSPHNQLPGHSLRESTYGYGWIRTQLPNQMCRISPNFEIFGGGGPILGEGAPPKLMISHYGSMPGTYCGVSLFPETESFLVMLSNSTPMCDSADWFVQLLTQTLFDFPQKNDYLQWAKKTVEAERQWHSKISEELEAARHRDTTPKGLNA